MICGILTQSSTNHIHFNSIMYFVTVNTFSCIFQCVMQIAHFCIMMQEYDMLKTEFVSIMAPALIVAPPVFCLRMHTFIW